MKRKQAARLRGVSVVLLGAMILVACGGSGGTQPGDDESPTEAMTDSDPTQTSAEVEDTGAGVTFRMRLVGDYGADLRAPTTEINAAANVVMATYDRLIALVDGEIVPYLAESWEVEPDQITFQLKEGAVCHDGTPVTPTVVADSFNWAVAPETGSPWTNALGAGPLSAEADDDAGTVTVKSETAYNEMLIQFATPQLGVVCPAGYAEGADPTKTYGSGPFRVVSATNNQGVVYERNEGWTWGPEGSHWMKLPETLEHVIVEDQATTANLLLTGELDGGLLAGEEVSRVENADGLYIYDVPNFGPWIITYNNAPGRPLEDIDLRRAISHVIDRRQYHNVALGEDQGVVSTGIFHAPMPCAIDVEIPERDPELAEQILTDAGYTNDGGTWRNPDGEEIVLDIVGSEASPAGPEYASEVLEAFGISTTLRIIPNADYRDASYAGTYDIVNKPYTPGLPTPTEMIQYLVAPNPDNGGLDFAFVPDGDLDELVAQAQQAPIDDRCAIWEEIQEKWMERIISLPAGVQLIKYVVRDGFGFKASDTEPEFWALTVEG